MPDLQQPPLAVTLPRTDYFELDSAHVGDRFAVWVTTPVYYDRDPDVRFPAIYVTDGNEGDGSAHHRVRKITLP